MRLLTGSDDGAVVCWTEQGEELARAQHKGPVHSVCFSQEGGFCSSSLDGTAVLYDATAKPVQRIDHDVGVRAVCCVENRIWTADVSGHARCTHTSGTRLYDWQAHSKAITSVCCTSATLPILLTGARDGNLTGWDAEVIHPIFNVNADSIAINSVTGLGMLVASGGVEAVVRVFDTRTEHVVHSLGSGTNWAKALCSRCTVAQAADTVFAAKGHSFAITCIRFVDSFTIVSSGADRKVLIWDLRSPEAPAQCIGHELAVLAVATTRGKIYSSSDDLSVREWARTGEELSRLVDIHYTPIFALDAAERSPTQCIMSKRSFI